MKYKNNRVVEILKIKYPLIQAPMIWITDARMVSTVSNVGGLGVLGPNAGYRSIVTDPELTAERMREEIRKTKKLTENPFAVNIVLPYEKSDNTLEYSDKILEVCFEEEIRYFVVSGDIREEYFNKIKNCNGNIIYRPINPSIGCMKKAKSLGADILVATGYDEGNTGINLINDIPSIEELIKRLMEDKKSRLEILKKSIPIG
ncbi:MAG: nitronate monooxygenase [Fusobacterium sp.]|uniref:NAD(P)H-dependent flavin oxidoreductase n=1 Tax=Fusobacterium sp. TaxID=68766 RepID=UPI0026DDC841|nr:nitronate monooxygenase [Fusobacterium sp.]MDO4691229.1 nitronate monooxygenase [Fusobacterium sp.]